MLVHGPPKRRPPRLCNLRVEPPGTDVECGTNHYRGDGAEERFVEICRDTAARVGESFQRDNSSFLFRFVP